MCLNPIDKAIDINRMKAKTISKIRDIVISA